jgi:hypothetical protein
MEQTVQSTKQTKTYIPGETKAQRKARKALEKANRNRVSENPVSEQASQLDKHIVCLKWGTKYSADYVNKLHNMCSRHSQQNYHFHCFTDNASGIQDGIIVHPLPNIDKLQGWWFKPWFFSDELPIRGTLLFLDLDVVICNNIDRFFNYEPEKDFVIIRDFNRSIREQWDRVNSSVFRLRIGSRAYQYQDFIKNKDHNIKRLPGDQDWMYRGARPFVFWPDEWVRSYKWEMRDRRDLELRNGVRVFKNIGYPKVDKQQSIAVFHGRPFPEDCKDPWVIENWQ